MQSLLKVSKWKILFILLLLFILIFSTVTHTVFAYSLGDVNNDGRIDVQDVVIVMKHILGLETLTTAQQEAADVNKYGAIDVRDVTLIMQMALGLIDEFPPEPEPEPEPEPDDGKCTFVNVEVLHLRSGPGTDYEIIDSLFYGTPLEVKDSKNGWLFVDVYPGCVYRNNQGWVNRDYVESGYGPYPCHPSDDGVNIGGELITFFMEVSEVVNLIGEPTEVVLDDDQDFSIYDYHYPGVVLSFSNIFFMISQFSSDSSVDINEYLLFNIKVDGNQVSGPRDIRVGDSYESVLSKFPNDDNAIKAYSEDTRGEYRRILYGRDEIPPVGYIYYDKNQKPLSVWFNNYPESYLFIEFEDEKVSIIYLYLQVM